MILILSEPESTVASVLSNRMTDLKCNFLSVSIDFIIKNLDVCDTITSDGVANIKWRLHNKWFEFSQVKSIYNEISDLDIDDFSHVSLVDREYCRNEYKSYIHFALSKVKKVLNKPSYGSLSGSTRSLPYQWTFISSKFQEISVPEFYYGKSDDLPISLARSPNLIVSPSAYSYTYWRAGNFRSKDDNIRMYYLRPPGRPFTVINIEDQVIFDSDILRTILIQEGIDKIIRNISDTIRAHFGIDLFQTIYFYDIKKRTLCFGCVSPRVFFNQLGGTQESYIDTLLTCLDYRS